MKILHLLVVSLLVPTLSIKAQTKVTVLGQINHFDASEKLYLKVGESLTLLKRTEQGQFSVAMQVPALPSHLSLTTISDRGKIERQLPLIWFDTDTIRVTIDWQNKTYEIPALLPIQATSERIESLNGNSRKAHILKNPNTVSLYFAHREKDEFSLSDLEGFLAALGPKERRSSLAVRLEHYVKAKKLGPVAVGEPLKDFQLADEDGNLNAVLTSTHKPKLITLFSSSCQFSIASIKLLAELNERNRGQFELVTIWTDENRDTWLNAYKDQKAKITWTNLWDEFGYAQTYLDLKAWPTFYLVDEKGVLTDKFTNSKSTVKKLRRLVE